MVTPGRKSLADDEPEMVVIHTGHETKVYHRETTAATAKPSTNRMGGLLESSHPERPGGGGWRYNQ